MSAAPPVPPTVLVIPPHLGGIGGMLAGSCEVLKLWEDPPAEALARVRAILTAGEFPVERALTDRMPNLGLVACIGAGYDGVDLAWARARGVAVTAARDVNQHDVADHALGLILASRRQIVHGDRILRAGQWTPESRILTPSMRGQKLGVVGLGGIGRALAERAQPMGLEIRWWGRNAKADAPWLRVEDLIALARWSDILAVCVKANEETRRLITAEIIHAVGADGLLVNVSRGQVIDEDALIDALRDGRLGSAALDVFEGEPTPAERWSGVPNTVLTPHTAGATREAVQQMIGQMMSNLTAFFAGQPVITPVED